MSNTRKPRIYHPYALIIGETIEVDAPASAHITQVLRMRINEAILLFNNESGEYLGINKKY